MWQKFITFEKELPSCIDQYHMLLDQVESFEKFHKMDNFKLAGNSESCINKKVDKDIINEIRDLKGKV